MFSRLLLVLWIPLLATVARADEFTLSDIRFDGLQRVELGVALDALGLEVGQAVDGYRLGEAARALFATGYFDDMELARDGDLLIVRVVERPAISRITLEGNKAIKSEQLLDGLKRLGLAEGEVFQRSALERIQVELLRLYAAQGRYGARVETEVERLPENRVGLKITISEGSAATIEEINIVGNRSFDDATLLDLFELEESGFWSFFGNSDRYAREKLSGDLDRLRAHYLDRGFINFRILSTDVSLTPDRKHVYISIRVEEGEQYRFSGFSLSGDLVLPEEQLRSAVTIEEGALFSRSEMVKSADAIGRLLGDEGFLQANINPVPEIDDQTRTVSVRFYVQPGKRIYVRRINFRGNTGTADEVLRREMRQMEAAIASSEKIEQSKRRLERLGFFSSVNLETSPVPGVSDQIDLEYSVVEQLSGNLAASIGYSQGSGMILSASVTQDNFFGTGKAVSFEISNSDTDTIYSFSYTDPYYTIDGVSVGYSVFYRQQDYEEDDLSDYNLDSWGGSVSFGYPFDEYQRLNFSLKYENLDLQLASAGIPEEITDFVAAEGDSYRQYGVTVSWSSNHLNKGLLATEGYYQTLSLEAAAPGSDLGYYKLQYRGQIYLPLEEEQRWVLSLKTRLGYGDSYGSTSELPFFKNFYAGGVSTVRGFKNNTLGPRSEPDISGEQDPLGGDVLITGSAELIFPIPGTEASSKVRTLLFLDAGSVFDTRCRTGNSYCDSGVRLGDLSASVGVGLSWLTFIGPMSFSLAKPIREQALDETETFQFTLGRTF